MQGAEATSADAQRERENLVYVEPYRWALSWWARLYRRVLRRWDVDKHVKAFCRPLTVSGQENLVGVKGPLLIVANHTSHFDTVIVLYVLPKRIWNRTATVAAADRIYRDKRKGMLFSLRYNAFPITRGGGLQTLNYAQTLLQKGWSILIYPEGKRSRTGELQRFHSGPAFMALSHDLTILPIHIDGANHILPAGERMSRPAPVSVRIGKPFKLPQGTSVPEGRQMMEDAMRALISREPRYSV